MAIKDGICDVEPIQLSLFLISLLSFSHSPSPSLNTLWCFVQSGWALILLIVLIIASEGSFDWQLRWQVNSDSYASVAVVPQVPPSLTSEAHGVVLWCNYLEPQIQIHSNERNCFWFAIQESKVPECQPSMSFPWSLT